MYLIKVKTENFMEKFIQQALSEPVKKIIDELQDKMIQSDVIGVGEASHGEAVSWKYRCFVKLMTIIYKI